jgi:hypothetical protein
LRSVVHWLVDVYWCIIVYSTSHAFPLPPTVLQENEGAAGYVELYNAGQFVEEEGYVGVLLALLEEKESYVRLNTAQLLTTLIQQKASTLQVRRPTAPPRARNSGSTAIASCALLWCCYFRSTFSELRWACLV